MLFSEYQEKCDVADLLRFRLHSAKGPRSRSQLTFITFFYILCLICRICKVKNIANDMFLQWRGVKLINYINQSLKWNKQMIKQFRPRVNLELKIVGNLTRFFSYLTAQEKFWNTVIIYGIIIIFEWLRSSLKPACEIV